MEHRTVCSSLEVVEKVLELEEEVETVRLLVEESLVLQVMQVIQESEVLLLFLCGS
jgi:hypothetical protein